MDLSAGRNLNNEDFDPDGDRLSNACPPLPHSDMAKPTAKKEGPGTGAPGHSKGREDPMEMERAVAAWLWGLSQLEASEGGAWRRINREMEIEQWRKTRKRRRKSERHRRKWEVKGMRVTCAMCESGSGSGSKRGEDKKRDDIHGWNAVMTCGGR
jgi:hypothetical protein